MTPAYDELMACLRQLPGLGARSAERIALHLLVERPERLNALVESLTHAAQQLHRCATCGNLCEGHCCAICADDTRQSGVLCIVEQVPDLLAIERSGNFRGRYHVLHGKLSPLRKVGPEQLNLASLKERFASGAVGEVILALGNDIEGEATCHYVRECILPSGIKVTRIGFGLPSGGALTFADAATLRSALESRRDLKS